MTWRLMPPSGKMRGSPAIANHRRGEVRLIPRTPRCARDGINVGEPQDESNWAERDFVLDPASGHAAGGSIVGGT